MARSMPTTKMVNSLVRSNSKKELNLGHKAKKALVLIDQGLDKASEFDKIVYTKALWSLLFKFFG